jgi:hypothetical protein
MEELLLRFREETGIRTPTIDLIEVRRQLVAMRSQHSHDHHITALINKLLGKLAYLHEPKDRRHEERLTRAISKTLQIIERINQGE